MEDEKQVDEAWKDKVAQNSGASCCSGSEDHGDSCSDGCLEGCCDDGHSQEEMKVDFSNYIMSMAYQAMIFLGEVPSPVSGQKEENVRQAKFLIDTLSLLKEKTRGNLTGNEDNLLSSSLAELQMKYVEVKGKK